MGQILEKVTAFVLRETARIRELLLFEHPYAGVQLPAGTVQEGEAPDAAALREAHEETGLTRLAIREYLGMAGTALPADYRGVCQQATVYARPDPASFDWAHVVRGAGVRLLGRQANGFTHVAFEEYDREPDRRYLTYGITGWVRDEALAEAQVRHFYLLEFSGDTPDRWTVEVDNHVFNCFWAPLSNLPALIPHQDRWLQVLLRHLADPS